MPRAERDLRQLVKWRRQLDGDALAAHAAAQARVAEQEQQLQDLLDWRRSYRLRETGRSPQQQVHACDLVRARAFLANLDRGLQQQRERLERSVEDVERSRQRWITARADLRAAETLLERRLAALRKRSLQKERIALDEFGARTSSTLSTAAAFSDALPLHEE